MGSWEATTEGRDVRFTLKDRTWERGGSGKGKDKASCCVGLSSAAASQQGFPQGRDRPGKEVTLKSYSRLCCDDLVIIPRFGKFTIQQLNSDCRLLLLIKFY